MTIIIQDSVVVVAVAIGKPWFDSNFATNVSKGNFMTYHKFNDSFSFKSLPKFPQTFHSLPFFLYKAWSKCYDHAQLLRPIWKIKIW